MLAIIIALFYTFIINNKKMKDYMSDTVKTFKTAKNIIVPVGEDTHRQVKIHAANRNISIKSWVLQAIAEKLKREITYE